MANQIGTCNGCGQRFKRSRVAGRKKGYRVVRTGENGIRIQCESCGRKTTIGGRPA